MTRGGLLLILLAVCGCGGNGNSGNSTVTVRPGESIQAAIDAAGANATIDVEPGVYHESAGQLNALVITRNSLRLVGLSTPSNPVVLENAGGQKNGIWVSPVDSVNPDDAEAPPCGANGGLLHGFLLRGFTVRGFDQYGVYLACVDGFTLTDNLGDGNQVYSLFPVRSHHGTMSFNEAQGTAMDAALYVGQSDNAAGLIADVMPNLQKTDQTNVLIANNDVHDNNLPNTSTGTASGTPPGTGVVILGGSMVTVRNNTIANNGFQGIIVSSYCTGVPVSCTGLDIDPNPENNHVINNTLMNNGTGEVDPAYAHFAADLFWDRTGTGNCWSGNTPTATVYVLGGTTLPACM